MPEIKIEHLLMFAGFVLPGAISMYFYALIVPQKESRLQDRLLDAVCFSILNFVIMYWPISTAIDPVYQTKHPYDAYSLVIISFVIAPAVWPFLLVRFLRIAERQGVIAVRAKTAWDAFFEKQRQGFWIQVVLNDGTVLGGKFGKASYASAYPEPGHLHIEELWEIDQAGAFQNVKVGSPGVILRPSDYKFVKVYTSAVGAGNDR